MKKKNPTLPVPVPEREPLHILCDLIEGLTKLIDQSIENQEKIMADISKLVASVAKLDADVDALIAKPTVPSQAEVDAVQASVDATDVKVVSALAVS